LSPDTDVYNVGLPLQCIKEKDVIVQVSTYSTRELRLLNLSNLISALQNDPDLAHVNPSVLAKVMQTIYVVTGCDYISFYQPAAREAHGWLVLRLLCVFHVCWYIYLCVRTYHVRNNYVTYIVAMRPCLSQLRHFRRLLCVATMNSVATIMSSLAQLRVRDRYQETEAK